MVGAQGLMLGSAEMLRVEREPRCPQWLLYSSCFHTKFQGGFLANDSS